MRKVQDHVLEQRRTRYISYDRESLRKPSERKGYFKKGQRREGKGEQHCKKTKSKGGKDWMDELEEELEETTLSMPGLKKKTSAERKMELLSK